MYDKSYDTVIVKLRKLRYLTVHLPESRAYAWGDEYIEVNPHSKYAYNTRCEFILIYQLEVHRLLNTKHNFSHFLFIINRL